MRTKKKKKTYLKLRPQEDKTLINGLPHLSTNRNCLFHLCHRPACVLLPQIHEIYNISFPRITSETTNIFIKRFHHRQVWACDGGQKKNLSFSLRTSSTRACFLPAHRLWHQFPPSSQLAPESSLPTTTTASQTERR